MVHQRARAAEVEVVDQPESVGRLRYPRKSEVEVGLRHHPVTRDIEADVFVFGIEDTEVCGEQEGVL